MAAQSEERHQNPLTDCGSLRIKEWEWLAEKNRMLRLLMRWIIRNSEQVRIWKEVALACFRLRSVNSSRESEECVVNLS